MATKKATSSKRQRKPEAAMKDDSLDFPASLKREPVPAQKSKVETTTITKPTATPVPTEATEKAKTPVKVKEAKKATLSMSRALKDLLVVTPKMPIDELVAKLEGLGFKGRSVVTIQTLRSDTLTTLAAARDAGVYTVPMD